MGDCLTQVYGQGESPMTITTLSRDVIADYRDPRWQSRIASVGKAVAICDVAVVDASGGPVARGALGGSWCAATS
jgi:long-chain acyl-CoA synthetase